MLSEWIIGTDPDGAEEYIVHTTAPRFIARVTDPDDFEAHHDVIVMPAGEVVAVMTWIDTRPGDEAVTRLLKEATTALEIYTQDSV